MRFDEVPRVWPPDGHDLIAAIVYGRVNQLRVDKCQDARDLRHRLASYVHPTTILAPTVTRLRL